MNYCTNDQWRMKHCVMAIADVSLMMIHIQVYGESDDEGMKADVQRGEMINDGD